MLKKLIARIKARRELLEKLDNLTDPTFLARATRER